MKTRRWLAIALALPVLAQAPPAVAKPQRSDRLEAVQRINALRAQSGVHRLKRSRSLTRSASNQARYMLRSGYFGHRPSIRAPRRYSSVGEIILMHYGGHGKPRRAVDGWAGSYAHRDIMLSGKYRAIGVGKASGSFRGRPVTMWAAQVGRR